MTIERIKVHSLCASMLTPSNAEVTFFQSTTMQIFWKTKPCHVGIYWISHAE